MDLMVLDGGLGDAGVDGVEAEKRVVVAVAEDELGAAPLHAEHLDVASGIITK